MASIFRVSTPSAVAIVEQSFLTVVSPLELSKSIFVCSLLKFSLSFLALYGSVVADF